LSTSADATESGMRPGQDQVGPLVDLFGTMAHAGIRQCRDSAA